VLDYDFRKRGTGSKAANYAVANPLESIVYKLAYHLHHKKFTVEMSKMKGKFANCSYYTFVVSSLTSDP
jgi:hypothetical protein